jgi:putative transposase
VSTSSKVPDARNLFKQIMAEPERMFELVHMDLKEQCERVVNELLKAELTEFLKRAPYERQKGEKEKRNYRNGSYKRTYAAKNIGEVEIEVPRDRNGEFRSQLLERYRRKEPSLERDIALLFLSGFSTRSVAMVSKALLGTAVSPTEVSRISAELAVAIEKWRLRDLSTFDIKYLIVDGVLFPMRTKDSIEKVPMLVVIGVLRESNRKVFLTIQQGTKDSASVWREVFKDLKSRGLNPERVQLGIMDGLSGLETVFSEEFPKAKIQRCQVHVSRNVLAKVPRKRKQEVADRVRDIFYAPDRPTAKANFEAFKEEYSGDLPSAVRCLETSLERCLTFYSFPEEEWISLRTTNAIERVNKEFKRRTKPMEILAGERSAYTVLCFVALKLEQSWKSAPLGGANLPVLQKFTQDS